MTVLRNFGLSPVLQINAQSGTTYTLALTDEIVTCANASAITVTVPANGVAFPIGSIVVIMQTGAGQITFSPGVSVTLNSSTGNLTTSAQNSIVVLRKVATNTWQLSGDLTVTSNVIARDATELSVNTTSAKTTLYSFSLPANKIGVDKTLAILIAGDIQINSGSCTITVTIEFGGTTLYADTTAAWTNVAGRHPFRFALELSNHAGSASSQILSGHLLAGTGATTASGEGDLAVIPTVNTGIGTAIFGTSSVDTTSPQTFTVSLTMSVSNAANGWKRENAIAYLLGEGQKGDAGAVGPTGTGAGSVPENPLGGRTSTSDTPLSTDYGVETPLTNASAITCTIPSSGYLTAGQIAFYRQGGAGAITFAPGSGVTIDGTSLVTRAQYSVVAIRCISATHYVLVGDTA